MPTKPKISFLTSEELAIRWHISQKTLNRWCTSGIPGKPPLSPLRIGRRLLFNISEIEAWERESAPKGPNPISSANHGHTFPHKPPRPA